MDTQDIFHFVDHLINRPTYLRLWGEFAFSPRLGRYVRRSRLGALEEKVWEWSKEHPVLWNVGSFVPTLTRLLFDRTKDLYGPYDQITRVRLPPPAQAAQSQRRLLFEVLTEMLDDNQEVKQLAAEESYFGYGNLSDNLMLQALGVRYMDLFVSDRSIQVDPLYERQPGVSPMIQRIWEAFEGKRHLLLVENLHVPVSLDVLVFIMNCQWPSIGQNRRWLISTNSKDVCEKSRDVAGAYRVYYYDHLPPEYYYAPPLDDLRSRDWAVLIKEALHDAARSIYIQLPDKGDEKFWLHVAQQCLYYCILYHPLPEGAMPVLTSDELVRCWVAEDLLFSTAILTNTPAATGRKQSNYYRSAYEAGKVVIQALQKYSLLPSYSVPTPTVSTSSTSKDVVTGVSKLSKDVPRLKQEELNTHEKSKQLRWVSFMNDDGRHVSWDWKPRKTGDTKMTTLILRGYSNMSAFPLDQLLTPHLHVLDLSYTSINSLPPSFSNLLNLYLLSLRGCTQLQTLSPTPNSRKETSSLACLENLQVLDMNGVPLLELTEHDCSNKSNLHYLDLSGSEVTTLPPDFFQHMSNLEELILGNCSNLKEMPLPVAESINLLVLHVEGTEISSFPEEMFEAMQSLHTLRLVNNLLLMRLPKSLSEAKGLKQLHLCNCARLSLEFLWELVPCLEDLHIQTWKSLENIKIHGHPTLRTFSLSGTWIRCLSLRGCSELKIVNFSDDLTALEQVDLSGTNLEEVSYNLPNLPQLRMLLLLGVPSSMRFPWHQLVRFPKIFYLDHCADDDNQYFKMLCQNKLCADGDHQERERTTNTAQININDPRMFHSFNSDTARQLVEEGEFLQSFNVHVQPRSVRGKRPQNNEVELSTVIQRHSTYHDVQYSAGSIMPVMKLQPRQRRHVEISAVNQYPNGLRHILSVTNSIFVTDDNFVRCLTDLNYSLIELEECQLQRCHQMNVVFLMRSYGSQALPTLKILQASSLKNLLSLVEPSDLSYSSLTLNLLKHIHLEHCPRLEKLFPCSLSLPALETLVILFCTNLKTIFYKQPQYRVAPSPLPNIKKIYLQELPQLQHIHDNIKFEFEAPNWQKIFVRGCRSFRRLPILKMEYPKSGVEVNGEREWWDRLQMELPEQRDYYTHMAPPEFVSRKKHIIQSYLRASTLEQPNNGLIEGIFCTVLSKQICRRTHAATTKYGAEAYTLRDRAGPSVPEAEGSYDAWEPTAVAASSCLCDEHGGLKQPYIAPECAADGELSTATDVYSSGIILLEIFIRRRPTDDMFKDGMTIAKLAEINLRNNMLQIVDPQLLQDLDHSMVDSGTQFLQSLLSNGLCCTKTSPNERISMQEVAAKLHGIQDAYLRGY